MTTPYAPHQQRVVDEKAELDAKIEKLVAFTHPTNEIFQGLPDAEVGRLLNQRWIMQEYSRVLGERVSAF